MQAATAPVPRDFVLISGGQRHVGVLHTFAMKRIPGARHCGDEVIDIARGSRKALCCNRPPEAHDAFSINIGSKPQPAGVAGAAGHAVPGKPIRCLIERWLAF